MLQIIIPMAGRGSRFRDAGYETPKPFIPVYGLEMILFVMRNITPGVPHQFTLVALREANERYELEALARRQSPGSRVVLIDEVSEGPAMTVLSGWEGIDEDQPLLIANSDQWVAGSIDRLLEAAEGYDGALLTMRDTDPKWSFVERDEAGGIVGIREKQPVSDEATVGVYFFQRAGDFRRSVEEMVAADDRVNGEFYVGPSYNYLVAKGAKIATFNVGEIGEGMHGLGIPADLDAFVDKGLGRELVPEYLEDSFE